MLTLVALGPDAEGAAAGGLGLFPAETKESSSSQNKIEFQMDRKEIRKTWGMHKEKINIYFLKRLLYISALQFTSI